VTEKSEAISHAMQGDAGHPGQQGGGLEQNIHKKRLTLSSSPPTYLPIIYSSYLHALHALLDYKYVCR
jgi:hypothetical protein